MGFLIRCDRDSGLNLDSTQVFGSVEKPMTCSQAQWVSGIELIMGLIWLQEHPTVASSAE